MKFRTVYVLFFLFSLSILFSCSKEKIQPEEELIKAVKEYYTYQKDNNWDATYEMRTPKFKKIVDKSYYKEQMAKDAKGWELIKFDIREAEKVKDNIVLVILFTYKISLDNKQSDESRIQSFIEKTEWEKNNGNWYSYDAGYQYHLSLNDPIVRKIK